MGGPSGLSRPLGLVAGSGPTHGIVQMCREIDTRTQVVAFTSWFGGDADDPGSIANLKINLVHTDATENIARALLTRFVCEGASLEEMDALIHEMGVDEEPSPL